MNRRWFTANWGLHFKEMFLKKTGAVQSIMNCCFLLGHLINDYYVVLEQQGSLFNCFSLVGCQKAQILQILLFCVFMFAIYRPVVSGERCLLFIIGNGPTLLPLLQYLLTFVVV